MVPKNVDELGIAYFPNADPKVIFADLNQQATGLEALHARDRIDTAGPLKWKTTNHERIHAVIEAGDQRF